MRRLALSDEEFVALRTLLASAAGLVFDDARRESVALSVAARLHATGALSVAAYLRLLQGKEERQCLLDEVTIQETHFFRNPPQGRALREHVLPELIREATARRRLRVWSAGCSTGEEPYTVAMMLRELLPASVDWDVQVLGTDVSQRALDAARVARYGTRALQLAAPADLARFFTPVDGEIQEVRREVRSLVALRHHNLVTDPTPYAPGEVDLVLCRNVTIYFGRETTRELVKRFHLVLREGGYLVLGHSETLWQVSEDFRLVPVGTGDSAAFVYQRLSSAEKGTVLPERRTVLPERRTVLPARRTALSDRWTAPEGPPQAVPDTRRTAPPPPDPASAVRTALAEGRYDDAARLAGQALHLAPLRADLHYLHGLALVDLRRDADAVVVLRRAVYLAPLDGFAHFLLAGVLARLGDDDAARREYAAAAGSLADAPPDPRADELGGRPAGELALLCRRLADRR